MSIKTKEFAAKLGFPNHKDVINILTSYSDRKRTVNSVLDNGEMDYVLAFLLAKNSIESFDGYFPEKKAEEKKPAPEAKAPEKGAADGKTADKEGKPAGKEQKKPAEKLQSRTKGKKHLVDTKSSNVNIDKYADKYIDMNAEHDMRNDRVSYGTQKIKSKQRNNTRQTRKENEREKEARKAKQQQQIKQAPVVVELGNEIVIRDLAEKLKKKSAEVLKVLFMNGFQANNINDTIDFDTAEFVSVELGATVKYVPPVTIEEQIIDSTEDDESVLQTRSPVVCVMGHVDHGKTSLLDAIRNTSVTAGEAGGITQHIGAYKVNINGNDITFLDTPGHAAFTSMRARGAMATDIAVLVVAADDGIMPQTIEAIHHAKDANVSIIVAINKMDKPDANPDRIKQQLTEHGLVPEEWGGDVICVPVSAKTKEGIEELLESINLVAEVKELKANPDRAARGIVIEAKSDKGRGPVATLLVQNGTLRRGDFVVVGLASGRIRTMTDYKGTRITEAGPSTPVEISGLDSVPVAGDKFDAVSDESLAKKLVEQRRNEHKEQQFNSRRKVTLDTLFSDMQSGDVKSLNIIVKADVQGSVEAVTQSLEKLSNDEVKVSVIHGGVGAINESDVMLANASNAIIVGFHVRPDSVAEANAARDNVEMRMYMVIYDCINDVESAIKGMQAPKIREIVTGKAEVREVFKISGVGTVAGCYITNGKALRNAGVRVIRDGIVIAEDSMASLKRFNNDAKEVAQGYECGIGLNKFNDIKVGDVYEIFTTEEYRD